MELFHHNYFFFSSARIWLLNTGDDVFPFSLLMQGMCACNGWRWFLYKLPISYNVEWPSRYSSAFLSREKWGSAKGNRKPSSKAIPLLSTPCPTKRENSHVCCAFPRCVGHKSPWMSWVLCLCPLSSSGWVSLPLQPAPAAPQQLQNSAKVSAQHTLTPKPHVSPCWTVSGQGCWSPLHWAAALTQPKESLQPRLRSHGRLLPKSNVNKLPAIATPLNIL